MTIRNTVSEVGKGIDVRGEGGMVIAPPSWRNDGLYRWENHNLIAAAPPWLLAICGRDTDRDVALRFGDGDGGEVMPIELVRETMKHVPGEGLDGWERKKVGMAIFVCTGGSEPGMQVFGEWLARCDRYEAYLKREHRNADKDLRRAWAEFESRPPKRTGYGKLEKAASVANPQWLVDMDKAFLALNGFNQGKRSFSDD